MDNEIDPEMWASIIEGRRVMRELISVRVFNGVKSYATAVVDYFDGLSDEEYAKLSLAAVFGMGDLVWMAIRLLAIQTQVPEEKVWSILCETKAAEE